MEKFVKKIFSIIFCFVIILNSTYPSMAIENETLDVIIDTTESEDCDNEETISEDKCIVIDDLVEFIDDVIENDDSTEYSEDNIEYEENIEANCDEEIIEEKNDDARFIQNDCNVENKLSTASECGEFVDDTGENTEATLLENEYEEESEEDEIINEINKDTIDSIYEEIEKNEEVASLSQIDEDYEIEEIISVEDEEEIDEQYEEASPSETGELHEKLSISTKPPMLLGSGSSNVYWYLTDSNKTLHLSGTEPSAPEYISGNDNYDRNCIEESIRYNDITKVIIDNEINPTNCEGWFYFFFYLTDIEGINNINTSNVTTMKEMFAGCRRLVNLDISSFDTTEVTSMWRMFFNCRQLTTLNLGNNFNTSLVTSVKQMFCYCYELASIDLSNFDTSSLSITEKMFSECTSLSIIKISSGLSNKINGDTELTGDWKDISTGIIYAYDNAHSKTTIPTGVAGEYTKSSITCKNSTINIGYNNLQDAINAVNNNETIVLLEDIPYTTAPNINVNNGKTFTIEFDYGTQHHIEYNEMPPSGTKDIISIDNNSNVIIKNANFYFGMVNAGNNCIKVKSGSTLKLVDPIAPSSNVLVYNEGGNVTFDGGSCTTDIFRNMVVQTSGNLVIDGNPTFKPNSYGLICAGSASNTDTDADAGNITIKNGTYLSVNNTSSLIELNAKANVKIEGANYSYDSNEYSRAYLINLKSAGYKSTVNIDNITSDSKYIVYSYDVSNLDKLTVNINGGKYKYDTGLLCKDGSLGVCTTAVKITGGYFGPTAEDIDSFNELSSNCKHGYIVNSLSDTDLERANGYKYKIVIKKSPSPIPTPSPSRSGSSGNGGGGMPIYDSQGNILKPGAIPFDSISIVTGAKQTISIAQNSQLVGWNRVDKTAEAKSIVFISEINKFINTTTSTMVTNDWVGVVKAEGSMYWYYASQDGTPIQSQLIQIGNNIFCFGDDGVMLTGNVQIGNDVFYFNEAKGTGEGAFVRKVN